MKIYRIQNNLTGDFYIGQTITDIRTRLSGHICDSKKDNYNSILHNSMRKYGSEYFTIGEIEDCNSLQELNERERYWISKCNPSLNIQRGGKNKGKHSNQSIELMSKKAIQRWNSYSDDKLELIRENGRKVRQTEEYKNLHIWKEMVVKKGTKIHIKSLYDDKTFYYNSLRECERDDWNRCTIQRSIRTNKPFTRQSTGEKFIATKEEKLNGHRG